MEAEKSHYLPSVNWRLRKAGDIVYLLGNIRKVEKLSRPNTGFLCSHRPISHSRFPPSPWGGRRGPLTVTRRQSDTSEAGSDGWTHVRCFVHLSHVTVMTSLRTVCYRPCIFAEEAWHLGTVRTCSCLGVQVCPQHLFFLLCLPLCICKHFKNE